MGTELVKPAVEQTETGKREQSTFDPDRMKETLSKEPSESRSLSAIGENGKEEIKNQDSKPTYHIETHNQTLENDRHPITGVEFVRKTVDMGDHFIEGVFPVFDSKFNAKVPENLEKADQKSQFRECNKQLYDKIQSDPEYAKQFSKDQIEQIRDGMKDGKAPEGYVWHHNEERGVIQLVDAKIHANTGHTGGKSMWGGGYD